jgi:hypothetical protein
LVDELLTGVASLGRLTTGLVLFGVGLGFFHHPVDLILGQARTTGDGHALLVARGKVLG